MDTTNITLSDFDTDDYTTWTLVERTPHGVFRAVVERDKYPEAPHDEYGCPVFQIHRGSVGDIPDFGRGSWRNDGLSHDIDHIWDRMSELASELAHGRRGWNTDTVDYIDRYLRIFHGGGATLISSTIHQGSDYLVYNTRAMRESWGLTGAALERVRLEASDWQAYIDGDVYLIGVEQAVEFDADGEPTAWEDAAGGWRVGGFYGDDYAAQEAAGELVFVIERLADAMLPLED